MASRSRISRRRPSAGLRSAIEPQRSFAHLLHNCGFGDADELRALASAWRGLIESVKPDLIVFDHSPTALLAARAAARKALIGNGFFCPLDECPMADLRSWLPAATDRLRRDEDHVLANANAVLAEWGQPPVQRLSRLFYDVDENFLVTLPELDHYPDRGRCSSLAPRVSIAPIQALISCPSPGERGEIRYWGMWPNVGGRAPCWPDWGGKRVFAYVKPFPALPQLLQRLCDLRLPTIVSLDGADENLRGRFAADSMRFENELLDLAEVARTCDLAILNGNHGTTVSMLLAGKPTLQVPITLEQGLFSRVVERFGAAVVAMPSRAQEVIGGLMRMLGSESYIEAARRFAAKYSGYDPQRQIAAVVERAEELLKKGQP